MKKILFTLTAFLSSLLSVQAEEAAYAVLSEKTETVKAKLEGVTLGSREVKRIAYEYPSTDVEGRAVKASGAIVIPANVLNGSAPCDGIIMYNHQTLDRPAHVPSQGGPGLNPINIALACPLKPNYIFVAADYLGYGSSIDSAISYICGDTNSRNALDGLLAARQLLEDRQIPQGKYLFNVGYSQGGTVSMFAAKLTDTEEKYKGIRFDKTFSGGGPLDFEQLINIYFERDACDDIADVALMLISANENYHLGIDYKDMFKEPMASKALDFFKSKDIAVVQNIGISSLDSISKILTPEFMNTESEAAKKMMAKLKQVSLTEGWNPDVTKQYYIVHSRHDNYVPIQCARTIIPWMQDRGFQPSIVPGKTSLQTNTVVFKLNHIQSSVVFFIQTVAALQFWPVVYYEGEQNRYYHDVVGDMNIMKVIRLLDSWGIDIKKIAAESGLSLGNFFARAKEAEEEASRRRLPKHGTLFDLIPNINTILAKVDLTTDDLDEMCSDSGITNADLLQVIRYLIDPTYNARLKEIEENVEAPLYLLRSYEQQLANWFLLAGIDTNGQWDF